MESIPPPAPREEAELGLGPRLWAPGGPRLAFPSPGGMTCTGKVASGRQCTNGEDRPLLSLSPPWVRVERDVPQRLQGRVFPQGFLKWAGSAVNSAFRGFMSHRYVS